MEIFFAIIFVILILVNLGGSEKKTKRPYGGQNVRPTTYKGKAETLEKNLVFDGDQKLSEQKGQPKASIEKTQPHKSDTTIKRLVVNAYIKKNSQIEDSFNCFGVTCLWHVTHMSNLDGILEKGILSHSQSHQLGINNIDISDPQVQRWRDRVDNPFKRRVHDFAPLYINPKNPMLYVRRNIQNELCLLEVSLSALEGKQFLITDGNAASRDTKFYDSLKGLENLSWDVLRAGYWNDFPDGRRKRCAEILVYPNVPPQLIMYIHCFSKETMEIVSGKGVQLKVSPNYFF